VGLVWEVESLGKTWQPEKKKRKKATREALTKYLIWGLKWERSVAWRQHAFAGLGIGKTSPKFRVPGGENQRRRRYWGGGVGGGCWWEEGGSEDLEAKV